MASRLWDFVRSYCRACSLIIVALIRLPFVLTAFRHFGVLDGRLVGSARFVSRYR